MLFRMNVDQIRFCPRRSEEEIDKEEKFFIWIRCNPLKRPNSAKESKEMQAFFLGFIWISWIYLAAKPNPRHRARILR